MSAPKFTFSINGAAAVTAESMAAVADRMELSNMDTDTLSLAFRRGMARPLPLQPGDLVRVFMDEQPIFKGRVATVPVTMGSGTAEATVQLLGPWWELERWPALRQPAGGPVMLDTLLAQSQSTPRFGLYGGNVGLTSQGTTYTGYAALLALLGPEYLLRANPLWVTAKAPAGVIPIRQQEVSQMKVSQLVRRAASEWTPHTAVWYDYSQEPPVMHFSRMSDAGPDAQVEMVRSTTPWSLAYDMTTGSPAEVPEVLTAGTAPLSGYAFTLRYDMVPPVALVRYEGTGGPGVQYYPAATQAIVPDALWVLVDNGVPAAGSAQLLYEMYATLRAEGEITLEGRTIHLSARPGRVWDILGDDQATGRAAGAVLWTQRVTHSLMEGRTVCQVGYPAHLGCQDVIDQLAIIRRLGVLG